MSPADKLNAYCLLLPVAAVVLGCVIGRCMALKLSGVPAGERKGKVRAFAMSGLAWLPMLAVFPPGMVLYSLAAAIVGLYGGAVACSLRCSR